MEQTRLQGSAGGPGFLEQEVERLSAAVRKADARIHVLQWTLALVVLLGLAGAAAGLYQAGLIPIEGFTPPMARRVEAREFGFYNRFGQRLVLTADDKFGLPELIFMDRKLDYRMGIRVWPEGGDTPGMVLYDKMGRGDARHFPHGRGRLDGAQPGGRGPERRHRPGGGSGRDAFAQDD